jgi:Na+/H+-dicarboxylate symporter
MTEISAVGRIGIRAAAVFFALLTAMALVMGPLISATWHLLAHPLATRPPLPAGAAEAAGQLSAGDHPTGLASWVVSLLPTNPVAAAANGAMVPLILFTLLLAIAITRTPAASRERLVGFFSALQDAVLVLVRGVIALTPIGVFAMLLPIAAHGGAATVGAVGFYVLFYSVVLIVATLLLYPVVAAFGGLSIARFARAVLPAQLIAFSASSSLAALPALIEAAEDDLILDQKVTGFVLPVAASMFKIAAPVSWTTGALFVSWFYGVPLPLSGLLVVLAAAVFLAFMAPGIPRGAFIMLAPVFLAAGLPIEGVGILVAVDALPDVFSSVLNATGNLAATTLVARMETRVAPVILSDSRLQPASGAVVAAE